MKNEAEFNAGVVYALATAVQLGCEPDTAAEVFDTVFCIPTYVDLENCEPYDLKVLIQAGVWEELPAAVQQRAEEDEDFD